MISRRQQTVKQAQKESFLLRELSSLVLRITMDEPRLAGLYISRVKLSPSRGHCTIYFLTVNGEQDFNEKLKTLVLFKPSLRSAIAKSSHARYTPELFFCYDTEMEKQRKVDELIEQLKMEDKL